jgi:hypothetical protein
MEVLLLAQRKLRCPVGKIKKNKWMLKLWFLALLDMAMWLWFLYLSACKISILVLLLMFLPLSSTVWECMFKFQYLCVVSYFVMVKIWMLYQWNAMILFSVFFH